MVKNMYTDIRRKGKHLTENERTTISHLLKLGYTQTAIAEELQVSPATICRELRRGKVVQLNGATYEFYAAYSPQLAHERARYMRTAHSPQLKIGSRRDYLSALEALMLAGSSPEDAIRKVGAAYGLMISKTTCYRYIGLGLFESLCYKYLPQGHRKKGKKKVSHANVSCPGHRSIETRSTDVKNRETLGHWELDSVVGKQKGKNESVLVLTERKTRAEIVLKPRDKTTAETVKSLQRLRRYLGRDWKLLFKTITCDNGSEFADQAGIDALGVQTFYCHPRCPSERGTNEINNKLVRRKFPKGQSLRKVTQKQAIAVQQWVNQYTRPTFGGQTAAQMLEAELDKLPLYNPEKVKRFFGII